MEITINEYKRLIVSESTLNHIIKIVEKDLELYAGTPMLSSKGLDIVKYLAIENNEIAERIEELTNAEYKYFQKLAFSKNKNKIERESGDK